MSERETLTNEYLEQRRAQLVHLLSVFEWGRGLDQDRKELTLIDALLAERKERDYVQRIVASYGLEGCDDLWWFVTDGRIRAHVNCNDEFYWGCADAEDITPENLPIFEQAFVDCRAADRVVGCVYAPLLFVCRVRGMRPQGCCYPSERALWPLFDAAGPEREKDAGNPYAPGERTQHYEAKNEGPHEDNRRLRQALAAETAKVKQQQREIMELRTEIERSRA